MIKKLNFNNKNSFYIIIKNRDYLIFSMQGERALGATALAQQLDCRPANQKLESRRFKLHQAHKIK